MHWHSWNTALALLGIGGGIAALNAGVAWQQFVLRRRAPSRIPLVGGVAGLVGILLLPLPGWHAWWVPLVLDWGSAPGLLYTACWHALRRHRADRKNDGTMGAQERLTAERRLDGLPDEFYRRRRDERKTTALIFCVFFLASTVATLGFIEWRWDP